MSAPSVERVDCVVIGAGVVGLAVARALAVAGREVTIVEAAPAIGTGISSRNSEVIHAGLHYAPDSLKARLCVRGRDLLYAYCGARHVPHRRIGKLLIATDPSQRPALDRVLANARACGVHDLETLDSAAAATLEPEVRCVAALWSPSTGIVDSHALMTALLADAEAHGAVLARSSRVVRGTVQDDGIELVVATDDGQDFTLAAALVVNCAGLDAARVARSLDGFPSAHVPHVGFAKGHYFAWPGAAAFRHLVYPLPEPGGLGIHVTVDLGGAVRFGPDVEWLAHGAALDYSVDAGRAAAFADSIRRYWPAVRADGLTPAYAGIRPKLSRPGEPAADFAIEGPAEHGVPGLIQLFGIESPGLTASLAIGERVVELVSPHRPIVSSISTMTALHAPANLPP